MKRLNNKGTSLIELIISITLISIVLLFMFRLLIDVNNEITNDTFAKDNQINRAEIIKTIESDLSAKVLTEYTITTGADTLSVKFYFKDINNPSVLTANKTNNTITYKSYATNAAAANTKKWQLDKNCEIYTKGLFIYGDNETSIYSLVLSLEIHTMNDLNTVGNNSPLDDITISHIGNTSDLKTGINSGCVGTCTKN